MEAQPAGGGHTCGSLSHCHLPRGTWLALNSPVYTLNLKPCFHGCGGVYARNSSAKASTEQGC